MDRHNILLFLMRDTMKVHPVGLEKERRNIFDPAEDPEPDMHRASVLEQSNGTEQEGRSVKEEEANFSPDDLPSDSTKIANMTTHQCAREDCRRKPRFDSLFCSDACGVSALELDLLRSFEESSDIHPSVLRN